MSIPVEIDHLSQTLADFAAGYLVTSDQGRVKVVSAEPVLADGAFRVAAPGRGSLANVGVNPEVTLVWPPLEAPGFSLIVDGTAAVDGHDVVITPTGGVLHKPVGQA